MIAGLPLRLGGEIATVEPAHPVGPVGAPKHPTGAAWIAIHGFHSGRVFVISSGVPRPGRN